MRRTRVTEIATGTITALVLAIALSGCGGDDSDDSALGASDSPVVTNDNGEEMLTCDGTEATFAAPTDGGQADCADAAPALKDGLSWVTVVGTPAGLTADSSTFEISVAERDCTGAASPGEAIHQPFVVKTDQAVTLYMTMDAPSTPTDTSAPGGSSGSDDARYCEGNPIVYGNVDIGEPLGDRTVYDGSTWPPTKIGSVPAG